MRGKKLLLDGSMGAHGRALISDLSGTQQRTLKPSSTPYEVEQPYAHGSDDVATPAPG